MSRFIELARRVWPSPATLPFEKLESFYLLVHQSSYALGCKDGQVIERHRIYAALEADPGALWRDQGFQEWRRNRVQD
jgi:hypothetical protein